MVVGTAVLHNNPVTTWQTPLLNSNMALFSRYVWRFLFPGIVSTYITVFDDNEGAMNLAQNPACTWNSKHMCDPLLRKLFFSGSNFIIFLEIEFLSSATSRSYLCYTSCCAPSRGDVSVVQYAEYE